MPTTSVEESTYAIQLLVERWIWGPDNVGQPKQAVLKTVVEKYNISGSGFRSEIGLFTPANPKSLRVRMRFLGD